MHLLDRIYCWIYSFLRGGPGKEQASGWAAAFAPLFFIMNAIAAVFSLEVFGWINLEIKHEKLLIGSIILVASAWSSWRYEFRSKGEEAIARFLSTPMQRRDSLIGGLIFMETFFCALIPAVVAIVKNPTP